MITVDISEESVLTSPPSSPIPAVVSRRNGNKAALPARYMVYLLVIVITKRLSARRHALYI